MFHCAVRSTLAGLCLVAGCVGPAASDGIIAEPLNTGGASTNIIVMNGLPPSALAANALLTHPDTPRTLVSRALVDTSFSNRSELIGLALHDPNAREVFGKIVTCALPPDAVIRWKDPFAPHSVYTFGGQLGLASSWAARGANEDEQQVVSACVLMLMNDVNYHIPVSPRGWSADGVQIDASVDARIWPFDPHGVPDPRFAPCAAGTGVGSRECGWDPAQSYVGTCVGNPLTGAPAGVVGIGGSEVSGGPGIGSGTGARILRVCHDLSSCAAGSVGVDVYDTQLAPYQCNVPDGGWGFFVAMTGAYVAGDSFTARPAATMVSAATPARALDVYRVAEAGWFGNVFTGVLNPGVEPVFVDASSGVVQPKSHKPLPVAQGAVYPDMFYCHAPDWTPSLAATLHRLCGDPTGATDCVATHVGACKTHCTLPGADDQGAFTDCRSSPGGVGYHTLTDYLFNTCQVSHGVDSCAL